MLGLSETPQSREALQRNSELETKGRVSVTLNSLPAITVLNIDTALWGGGRRRGVSKLGRQGGAAQACLSSEPENAKAGQQASGGTLLQSWEHADCWPQTSRPLNHPQS